MVSKRSFLPTTTTPCGTRVQKTKLEAALLHIENEIAREMDDSPDLSNRQYSYLRLVEHDELPANLQALGIPVFKAKPPAKDLKRE